MAMKVPIVVTRVGGVAEQVIDGTTGFLVEPRRADLLVEAITRLIKCSSSQKEQMTRLGYERVQRIFSLTTIAEIYKELYDELLNLRDSESFPDFVKKNS